MSKEYLEYIIATVIADHGLTDAAEVKKSGAHDNLKFAAWICCVYSRAKLHNVSAQRDCHRKVGESCTLCGVDFERPDEISWQGLHEELKSMQDSGI